MDVQSLLASGNFQRAEASHLPFIDLFFWSYKPRFGISWIFHCDVLLLEGIVIVILVFGQVCDKRFFDNIACFQDLTRICEFANSVSVYFLVLSL